MSPDLEANISLVRKSRVYSSILEALYTSPNGSALDAVIIRDHLRPNGINLTEEKYRQAKAELVHRELVKVVVSGYPGQSRITETGKNLIDQMVERRLIRKPS
ncbi:MAG: hypothetical protein V1944_00575 [Candidatus Aenigmatarchaeota archaeon]